MVRKSLAMAAAGGFIGNVPDPPGNGRRRVDISDRPRCDTGNFVSQKRIMGTPEDNNVSPLAINLNEGRNNFSPQSLKRDGVPAKLCFCQFCKMRRTMQNHLVILGKRRNQGLGILPSHCAGSGEHPQ